MMIGQSPSLRALQAQLRRYATCDAPVLLEGETGTGKELAAREIHYEGRRCDKPFVPVNCGALPDSLIESELFGHCRGAFTDAKSAQAGLIDHAKHGTLFLDEVDSLSHKAQVTLLRFLEDNQYRPVGGGAQRAADVRVVAAVNTSLARLVAEGRFRRDLFYRLNPLTVCLPPLREREGDIALLADHFLQEMNIRMHSAAKRWTAEVLKVFETYPWPGNVRELENVVLRTCLCAERADVGLPELVTAAPTLIEHARVATSVAGADAERHTVSEPSHERALSRLHNAGDPSQQRRFVDLPVDRRGRLGPYAALSTQTVDTEVASFSAAKTSAIAAFEHAYLIDLMRRAGGNVSVAARLGNVERRQLGKLLKKRGIEKTQFSR